jgi:DDE superfamily endonuclease
MRTLPTKMVQALAPFAPLFSKRVWQNAQVLLMGAFPQPQVCEQSALPCARWAWTNTNAAIASRCRSHASWSSVKASRVLLGLSVEVFVPEGDSLIVGIDETLERRWAKKIAYTRASTVIRFVPPTKMVPTPPSSSSIVAKARAGQ